MRHSRQAGASTSHGISPQQQRERHKCADAPVSGTRRLMGATCRSPVRTKSGGGGGGSFFDGHALPANDAPAPAHRLLAAVTPLGPGPAQLDGTMVNPPEHAVRHCGGAGAMKNKAIQQDSMTSVGFLLPLGAGSHLWPAAIVAPPGYPHRRSVPPSPRSSVVWRPIRHHSSPFRGEGRDPTALYYDAHPRAVK